MDKTDAEMLEQLTREELGKPLKYFSHDTDAFEDDALYTLWDEGGWAWYGLFWRLCELLGKRDGHSFPRDVKRLSYELRLSEGECEVFLTRLHNLQLLSSDSWELGFLRSTRMDKNDEATARKVASRKLGAFKTNKKGNARRNA